MPQPLIGELDENGNIYDQTGKVIGKTTAPKAPTAPTAKPGVGMSAGTGANATAGAATASGSGSDGMGNFTGFMKQQGYTGAMSDQLYQNPWYILADALGADTTSPLYQSLRNMKGDPLALYNMTQGATQNFQQEQGANEYGNWLAKMYQQLATPGAGGISATELLRNIFSQDTSSEGATGSSLASILSAGDITDQVRTLYNLAKDATAMGMNPLAATGYQSALARALDTYGNSQLKAGADTTMTPLEWLKQNDGGLVVR